MEKRDNSLNFGFNQYFYFLQIAVLNPNQYSTYLKSLSLGQGLLLFIISASLWLFISAGIRTFLLKRSHLFFAVLSETLILIALIFLLLLIFTIVLHFLAKIFGSRTKIKSNLKAVLFSTILLPFFAIPIFKVLAVIISIYILIFNYKAINRFDRLKAIVPIIIPLGILGFILYSMGIININLLTR